MLKLRINPLVVVDLKGIRDYIAEDNEEYAAKTINETEYSIIQAVIEELPDYQNEIENWGYIETINVVYYSYRVCISFIFTLDFWLLFCLTIVLIRVPFSGKRQDIPCCFPELRPVFSYQAA